LKKSRKRLLIERQNHRCCWCGKPMSFFDATWEHIVPLSLGGANEDHNLALAHESCNKLRNSNIWQKPHESFLFDFVRAVLERNGAYRAEHFPPEPVDENEFWRQQR
jgi:5-methylcytosine-specific restriction protein A